VITVFVALSASRTRYRQDGDNGGGIYRFVESRSRVNSGAQKPTL